MARPGIFDKRHMHAHLRRGTIAVISFALLFTSVAQAASLYFSPSSGNYSSGKTFSVYVTVGSTGQPMNAVQGVVVFPPEKLSVISLSKAGSIVNLWIQEPSFDNVNGQVTFEGVVLNPGFSGSAGRILQITFRARATGLATVSLTGASVLANDGQGTNVLTGLDKGRYLIETAAVAPRLPVPGIKFIVTSPDGLATDNPRPRVKFEVENLKGTVDHYEIRVDQGDFASWVDDGTHTYTLPLLGPGKHTIAARAFYEADKFLEASIELTVTPLNKPEITEYPRQLDSGDALIVKGRTYPNVAVTVHLQKDIDPPVDVVVKSDATGDFVFLADKRVSAGIYKFWAEVQDERGARSEPTEKLIIAVRESAIIRIGSAIINALVLVFILLAVIALLTLIMLYTWYRIRMFKRRLDRKVTASEADLHEAFKELKADVEKQVAKLEKAQTRRELTKEEHEVRRALMKHLDTAEHDIEEKFEDIDKELKK